MATVYRNQLGTSGEYEPTGWTIDEIVRVEDPSGSGINKIIQAINASGLPRVGDTLPASPTVTLRRISLVGQQPNCIELRLQWRDLRQDGGKDDPDSQTVEYTSGLRSVETNKDINGALMDVQFLDASGTWKKQSGTVAVDRPVRGIRVSRVESVNPSAKQIAFVGRVNAAGGFTLGGTAAAARTWRCDAITGTTTDAGKTWHTEYAFTHAGYDSAGAELAWDSEVIFIDPETGRVPQDVIDRPDVQHRAVEKFVMYKEANFNALGL